MPIVLATVLALSLLPWAPPAEVEPETVTILVPEDSSPALSSTKGAGETAGGWQRIEVPIRGSLEETVAEIAIQTGGRAIVEQRYELSAPQDEPFFDEQWHHENRGLSGGVVDADVDSLTAWDSSLGDGVVVAVIDSGVNMSHPDLIGQIHDAKWDFFDDDNDPSPSSTNSFEGHGTAVAGVIAAAANGVGIIGVAPGAEIMVIRSCQDGGCMSLDLVEGIHFAVDHGADIINLSLGSVTSEDDALEDAIDYARSHDILVVTAAGNDSIDLDNLDPGQRLIPGGLPLSNILTVAASDRSDNLAGFSNYGPGTVDIVAPGVDILTTVVTGGYDSWQGTSFSSPLVAGVAALLLSAEPGTGHEELIARITSFVDRPPGVSGASSSGRVNAGRLFTQRFIDTSSSLFVNAIDWLADREITEGCNPPQNHRFCPNDRVSRGEMAVFLSRAFGLPDTGTDFFDDDNGFFYEGAANRLRAAGLTVGCGIRRYCGEDDIRRDEMAAMLARALSLPSTSQDFFDDDDGSIFENAINKIADAGVTEGCNPPANTNYCPTQRVTRGQMAAFIKRSLELSG
ncbi:MAG: S8 family peptidase [Acidimicrobiia bacterium]